MPKRLAESAAYPPTAEAKLRRENAELRHQLNSALGARVLDEDYERFILKAMQRKVRQPGWTMAVPGQKRHFVVPVTNFSDWHLDEKVNPEEVQNLNGYDRSIALHRLKFYTQNVCKVAHTYVHGFHYPGLVVNFLGDNFSGFIHEELRRTNEGSMMESLIYWLGPVSEMLETFAREFGRVWITGVVGNHGRYDKKPLAKMRAHENFDWLFMQLLRAFLEKKLPTAAIQWQISNGQKLRFNIFDQRIITTHGDECKGGSGIAGMLSPQLIAFSRMKKTYEFDQWWCGHWHHLASYRGIRVNGTGKGYDEYAALFNFDFQPPMQDFFLIAPRAGVIASWPIHCQLPDEPWVKHPPAAAAFSSC